MNTQTINQPEKPRPQEIVKQFIVGEGQGEFKILYQIGSGSFYFLQDGRVEPVLKEQAQRLIL